MSLLYFLPIISFRFSSKYARVGVAYVDTILVPIAESYDLDIVNVIELEEVIIKDYFYTLYDKFFVKPWV